MLFINENYQFPWAHFLFELHRRDNFHININCQSVIKSCSLTWSFPQSHWISRFSGKFILRRIAALCRIRVGSKKVRCRCRVFLCWRSHLASGGAYEWISTGGARTGGWYSMNLQITGCISASLLNKILSENENFSFRYENGRTFTKSESVVWAWEKPEGKKFSISIPLWKLDHV